MTNILAESEPIAAATGLIAGVLLAVTFGVRGRRADHRRVAADVEKYRGQLLACKWSFGWNLAMFFDGERYYEVSYRTATGECQTIVAKTGAFTGVWYREDTKAARDPRETC